MKSKWVSSCILIMTGARGYLLLRLHQWHVRALITIRVQRRYDLPSYGVKHRER